MGDDSGKGKSDWLGKVAPLVSVLILASTFMFSVWQYRAQQTDTLQRRKLDQLITLQTQIRSDTDALIQFPKSANSTLSGAQALLRDLEDLLNNRVEVEPNRKNTLADDRRRITEILSTLISDDCNFAVDREVQFSLAVFNNWPDYQEYLKDPKQRNQIYYFVVPKYLDAIAKIYDAKPDFIGRMKYDESDESYFQPFLDDAHMRPFDSLVRGFEKHLGLLNKADHAEALQLFHQATCNQPLTEELFGDFQPYDKDGHFLHCKVGTW